MAMTMRTLVEIMEPAFVLEFLPGPHWSKDKVEGTR